MSLQKKRIVSEAGFSMIGAIVSIGLVAIAVLMNMSLMGSIFSSREDHKERHDFDAHLDAFMTELDNYKVCEGLFGTLTGIKLETIVPTAPRDIQEITPPSAAVPVVKVGRLEYDNTFKIIDMKLYLATPYSTPAADEQYPLSAYFWLELEYRYLNPKNGNELHGAKKRLLYEVNVSPKNTTGAPVGEFVAGACVDYLKKYNLNAKKMACFYLGMHSDADGNCNLIDSDRVRATACHLTGYEYGGRHCDTETPVL